MATIADIPTELLPATKKNEFMIWVKGLTISKWTKKELLYLWANNLSEPWTRKEITDVCGDV